MNYSYQFNAIQQISSADLSHSFIWILYADKIPPHIGISTANLFFSLKFEGKDERIPILQLKKVLNAKKITTVAVQLNSFITLDTLNITFGKYDKIPEQKSCLTPVLEVLNESEKISTISYLLKELKVKEQIKAYFGLNLHPEFTGLKSYTKKEIQARIKKLRHAQRK